MARPKSFVVFIRHLIQDEIKATFNEMLSNGNGVTAKRTSKRRGYMKKTKAKAARTPTKR